MKTKDIDKIAIQIMGWEKRKAYWSLFDSDADHWFKGDERQHNVTSWNPFINIAHAWQVVEKMTNDTLWFQIISVHGYGYEVTIFKAGIGKKTKHSIKDELITEFESTAPLAICKAALKAMEVE